MAAPTLTAQTIKQQAPDLLKALDYFAKGGADKYLQDLELQLQAMSTGMDCLVEGKSYNIQIGWNRDDANTINGLFFRVCTQDTMLAYKLLGTSGNEMLAVSNNKTEHFTQAQEGLFSFGGRLLNSIIPKLQTGVSPSDRKITCTILNLKDADKIKAFFDKNREMLPANLHARLYPASNNSTYLYLAGAALLLIAVAYFAKRAFFSSEPTQA